MIESEETPGSPSNRHIAYDVLMTSERPIRIEREDNKRPLTCNATVPSQKAIQLTILPTMLL